MNMNIQMIRRSLEKMLRKHLETYPHGVLEKPILVRKVAGTFSNTETICFTIALNARERMITNEKSLESLITEFLPLYMI